MGNGRVYIRPIQRDLDLDSEEERSQDEAEGVGLVFIGQSDGQCIEHYIGGGDVSQLWRKVQVGMPATAYRGVQRRPLFWCSCIWRRFEEPQPQTSPPG